MITATHTARDRSQLARKELARGAWRDGEIDNALLIIRSVLEEEMTPAVAAECYSAEAGFLLAKQDWSGCLHALDKMAAFLESADVRILGTFYNQRARAHRRLGNIDAALMDYSGALALWQESGNKDYEGAVSINLAELHLIIGDLTAARKNIEHAFLVLPQGSEYLCNAYDTLAKILLAEGLSVRALETIDRALELAGGNEGWRQMCLETKATIKKRLMAVLASLVNTEDLEELKVEMVRNALEKTGGSITAAADLINTSHQVVDYTARKHGLARTPRRRKHIIKHTR